MRPLLAGSFAGNASRLRGLAPPGGGRYGGANNIPPPAGRGGGLGEQKNPAGAGLENWELLYQNMK